MSAIERYYGHSRGVVVTNDGWGNFSESPMTPGQLAARDVAAKIADDIYRHANQAGICYYEFWKLISEAIDKERKEAYAHAAKVCRDEKTKWLAGESEHTISDFDACALAIEKERA